MDNEIYLATYRERAVGDLENVITQMKAQKTRNHYMLRCEADQFFTG